MKKLTLFALMIVIIGSFNLGCQNSPSVRKPNILTEVSGDNNTKANSANNTNADEKGSVSNSSNEDVNKDNKSDKSKSMREKIYGIFPLLTSVMRIFTK